MIEELFHEIAGALNQSVGTLVAKAMCHWRDQTHTAGQRPQTHVFGAAELSAMRWW